MTTLVLEEVEAAHDGVQVLRGISGSFAPGTVTALIGANGSGKSTLLHVIAGVHPLTAGRIHHGRLGLAPARPADREWRATVSLLMHDPDDQLFGATVCEDVSLGPTNLGLPAAEVTARVDDALAALELEELHDWAPHHLSHGQKLRVALAGLAAMHPRIVLMDEPTSGLDGAATNDLAALVERWRAEGRVIVVSTHDLEFAWRVADRVLVLARGRVQQWEDRVEVIGSVASCHAVGVSPPGVVAAHRALRQAGVAVDLVPPRTLEELTDGAGRVR